MVDLRTPTLSYTRVASFRRRLVGGVVCKVHKSEGQGKGQASGRVEHQSSEGNKKISPPKRRHRGFGLARVFDRPANEE